MSVSTLPELEDRWHELFQARWQRWEGFRLPRRCGHKKARQVAHTLNKGILPRGKAIQRVFYINRDKRLYV